MKLTSLLLLVLLAPLGFALVLELRVEPDSNNVTAGRLLGTWTSDPVVAERMGQKASEESFEFRAADDFLDKVPAKFVEHLKDLQIYESGVVVHRQGTQVRWTSPYLLVSMSGNPHLLTFRERGGDPLGDIESCNLFVAQGKERKQDLLLVGADFNNEPFRPFRRAELDK